MQTYPDRKSIAELAYRLWEARGRPAGDAERDWFEAEQQLCRQAVTPASSSKAIDESSKESFPASDPPGSRLPDVPPANAEAKWAAASAGKQARNGGGTGSGRQRR